MIKEMTFVDIGIVSFLIMTMIMAGISFLIFLISIIWSIVYVKRERLSKKIQRVH